MAIFVADGRDMALPLLAEGLIHDWNWILSELSLRNQARGGGGRSAPSHTMDAAIKATPIPNTATPIGRA